MSQLPPGFVLDGQSAAPTAPTVSSPPAFIPGTPKPPEAFKPPAGYLGGPEGLTPIPGGPADPDAKPDADKPPRGYRWNPDGSLEPIPGGPAEHGIAGNAISNSAFEKADAFVGQYTTLANALDTFQDDFGGNWLGGLENTAQSYSPVAVGTPGQSEWWAGFKALDNQIRNDLFGSALTPVEKRAYQATTIEPGMNPEKIKANLARRVEIIGTALERRRKFYLANGFKPDAVDALFAPLSEREAASAVDGAAAEAGPTPPAFRPEIAGGLRNAEGQIAGNVHDNGDSGPMTLASGGVRREDNPLLAGVRNEYIRRLERGDSADSLVAWAQSAGIDPTAAASIRAQAQFRQENPDVAIGEYDTSQLDDRVIALETGELGSDDINPYAAGVAHFGDALTGFNYDSIAGAAGGNAERTRIGMDVIRRQHPTASFIGTTAGVATNALVAEAGLARAGISAGIARTTGANALGGAYEGFGGTDYNSEGGAASVGDRLVGGLQQGGINALAAAGTTGAINATRTVAAPVGRAAVRAAGADKGVAVRQVGRALQEDGLTPRQAAARVSDAHSRGSPMALADVGENTRELAASMGRQRGESRAVVRANAGARQEQQMERISEAVRRDLGPTADIREVGEELIMRAKDESAPLYDEAFAAPGAGAVSPKLQGILGRPSSRGAMVRAHRLAAEEGRDPTALGFELNGQGDVTLTRVPSWETLHYIKTGLDDVIETYRDKTTGKLVLDAEGRLINNTKNALLKVIDGANPAYAAARKAYAGPVQMRDAMELGRGALTRSPDDVAANVKNLGAAEMEMYRLGLRKAIVDMIGTKGDYADKVNALVGTPKARAVLKKVLGGEANYDRFIKTLMDEREMGLTYKAVHGNSATAGRVAFDQTTSGENIAGHVAGVARDAKRGGVTGAVVSIGERVLEAGRLGPGAAGDKARAEIAQLLTEADPEQLALMARSIGREAAKLRLGNRTASKRAASAGTVGGAISAALGQETSPDQ